MANQGSQEFLLIFNIIEERISTALTVQIIDLTGFELSYNL